MNNPTDNATTTAEAPAPAAPLTREELQQRIDELTQQLGNEAWMHAACLTIAEGATCHEEDAAVKASLATRTVFKLRRDYDDFKRSAGATAEANLVDFNKRLAAVNELAETAARARGELEGKLGDANQQVDSLKRSLALATDELGKRQLELAENKVTMDAIWKELYSAGCAPPSGSHLEGVKIIVQRLLAPPALEAPAQVT